MSQTHEPTTYRLLYETGPPGVIEFAPPRLPPNWRTIVPVFYDTFYKAPKRYNSLSGYQVSGPGGYNFITKSYPFSNDGSIGTSFVTRGCDSNTIPPNKFSKDAYSSNYASQYRE